MKPKRIYILGTVGCGKTTLAKDLSKSLKIKTYDLDDIFWKKKFNKKRTETERNKLFKKLCDKKSWIVEGVYSTWIDYGIKNSDLVILLNPSLRVLITRITQRTLRRQKSKSLGKLRYKETIKGYLGLLKAAKNYKKKKFTRGYYKHKELVDKHKVNFVIIKNNKELKAFSEDLRTT